MSQDYSRARIVQGFKSLLEELRDLERPDDQSKRIRANTEARFAAQDRVRREYAAYGIEPPSDFALSITARKELNIGIVYVNPEEQAA
jgi:hypothetical protein